MDVGGGATMSVDPLFLEQSPALFSVLTQSLRLTFAALADMYDGKDGPWVDELRDAAFEAVRHADKTVAIAEFRNVDLVFTELRGHLRTQ